MTGIISFIILHYMTIEDTVACVESIKEMNLQNRIRIVIVDNASPNNSGKELQKKYKMDSQIHIMLNEENVGFSRGNNLGCHYAKKIWNPSFFVVTNNDVIFTQKDFCERLSSEYKRKSFDVLGIDIFCPNKGIHQSPISQSIPNIKAVKKTILINKIMYTFFAVLYPLIKYYYKKLDYGGYNAKLYNTYQENVCIMGACIIFSDTYMAKREKPFYPETNFYYEEFLLSLWCKKNGATIVYQPDMKVVHNEGSATKQISSDYRKKIKFRIRNIIDSAEIFKGEL